MYSKCRNVANPIRTVCAAITLALFISRVFTLAQVNSPPVIKGLEDVTLSQGSQTGQMPFTVWDAETAADQLSLRLESADPAVFPAEAVCDTTNFGYCFGGSGTNRSLNLNPGCNWGITLLRVIVADHQGATATNSFWLTVLRLQFLAWLDPIPDQVTMESTPATIPLRITSEPCNDRIDVAANSSNQLLAPNTDLVVRSSGTNWTLNVTPTTTSFGSATIRVLLTAGDGFTMSRDFSLRVNASLDIGWGEGSRILKWTVTNGVLQQATNVAGPWQDVLPIPASPYTLTGTAMKFYRLRAQ